MSREVQSSARCARDGFEAEVGWQSTRVSHKPLVLKLCTRARAVRAPTRTSTALAGYPRAAAAPRLGRPIAEVHIAIRPDTQTLEYVKVTGSSAMSKMLHGE